MTREAVADGFASFVDDIVTVALEEFDVVAALGGGSGSGSRLVSRLLKNQRRLNQRVIRPELRSYRRQVTDQFDVLLDYAADEGADFETYRDEVLQTDLYWRQLREDLRQTRGEDVAATLLDHHRSLAEAARPLVAADEDEFWAAAGAALDHEQATALVRDHFTFTAPLREYPGAFRFTVELDPSDLFDGLLASRLPARTIDYTDEAARTLRAAEEVVVDRTLAEVDRRFA